MLGFTDIMVHVENLGDAERSLTALFGFRLVERHPQWVSFEHPESRARVTVTGEDFGHSWALACHSQDLPSAPEFEAAGFPPPDQETLLSSGFQVLRGTSGLVLLLYR